MVLDLIKTKGSHMKQGIRLITAASVCAVLAVGCGSGSDSPAVVDDVQGATDSDAGATGSDATNTGGIDANAGTADSGQNTDNGSTDNVDLNGEYNVVASLNAASMAVPECAPAEGILIVTGTTVSGTVDGDLAITGTINSDLSITGGFAFSGGAKFADYTGMVEGEVLAGEWEDFRGCSGPWRAEKR